MKVEALIQRPCERPLVRTASGLYCGDCDQTLVEVRRLTAPRVARLLDERGARNERLCLQAVTDARGDVVFAQPSRRPGASRFTLLFPAAVFASLSLAACERRVTGDALHHQRAPQSVSAPTPTPAPDGQPAQDAGVPSTPPSAASPSPK